MHQGEQERLERADLVQVVAAPPEDVLVVGGIPVGVESANVTLKN